MANKEIIVGMGVVGEEKVINALKRVKKQVNDIKVPFDGAAMSIMFLGMAMQRFADSLWKYGVKTFQDVMHSVKGTVTQFDLLTGATDSLKFSLGAALEPLAGMLVPIVMQVSDWITTHERLVQSVVTAFGIGGAVLSAFGMVKLGMNGLTEKWGDFLVGGEALNKYNWTGWGSELTSKIVGAVGIISFAWALQSVYSSMSDFVNNDIIGGLTNAVQSGTFAAAWFVKNPKTRGALFGIGAALELVETDSFFSTLYMISGAVMSIFITWGQAIRHFFAQGFKEAMVDVLDQLSKMTGISYLLKLAGVNVRKELDSIMGTSNKSFDFWSNYKTNVASFTATGQRIDSAVKSWKDDINSMAEWANMQGKYGIQELSNGAYTTTQIINISATSQDEMMAAIRRIANQQG